MKRGYIKSSAALRKMRAKVDTWGNREEQAHKVLCYLKQRKLRDMSPTNTRSEAYANLTWM